MGFKFVVFCSVLATVMADSEKPRCICPKIYYPVCGTDNVTYENKCELNCTRKHNLSKADLAVRSEGRCENVQDSVVRRTSERCLCTKEFKPVCASNGRTYSNQCHFECAKKTRSDLVITRAGACEEAQLPDDNSALDGCICTLEYRPVCASNGQTFSNPCAFECARKLQNKLTVVKQGTCEGEN